MSPGRPLSGDRVTVAAGAGGRTRHRHRTRARAWVLQVLYRWETEGARGSLLDAMAATFGSRLVSEERKPHIRRILETLDDRLGEVDRALELHLDNWRLDRLSRIDRAILRLGATELLHMDDVPRRVAIQEALYLADRYGTDSSAGFVNGVLDALHKSE